MYLAVFVSPYMFHTHNVTGEILSKSLNFSGAVLSAVEHFQFHLQKESEFVPTLTDAFRVLH